MRKMIINLVLTFLTGLLAYYVLTRTITLDAVFVSLSATVFVAMVYLALYWIKKARAPKDRHVEKIENYIAV